MFRKVLFALFVLFASLCSIAQSHPSTSPLDPYVQEASEFSSRARATPFEDDIFPANVTQSGNTCPSVADCTVNTAADGTYHDAPVDACSSVPLNNFVENQIISMLVGSAKYQVRSHNLTYNSAQSGHGSVSDGIDINVSR